MAVREPPMRPDQLRSRSGRPRACPGGLQVAVSPSSIIYNKSIVISQVCKQAGRHHQHAFSHTKVSSKAIRQLSAK